MKMNNKQRWWVSSIIVLLAFLLLNVSVAFADNSVEDTYRKARRALNKNNFDRAAELFEEIHEDDPDSDEAPDALYWHAFALYRLGDDRDLNKALDLLDQLEGDYPDAAFLSDAEALIVRINSAQARHGDPRAHQRLITEVESFDSDDEDIGQALQVLVQAITELSTQATIQGLEEAHIELEELCDEGYIFGEDMEELFEELEDLSIEFEWEEQDELTRREIRDARRLIKSMDGRIRIIPSTEFEEEGIQIIDTGDNVRIDMLPRFRIPSHSGQTLLHGGYLVGDGEDRVFVYEPPSSSAGDDIRLSALNTLLQMDSDRAMPILTKILRDRDDEDAELRERAIFIVGQSDEPEAAELLLEVAREDPDDDVREGAVFWLSQVGGDESLDALADIFRSTRDSGLKDKTIFAIGQHDSDRAMKILRDIAADSGESTESRETAIFWLGQQDGDAFDFLTDLYRDMEGRAIKEKLIFSIAQNDDRESADWLMSVVRNRREETALRCHALFWAAQVGDISTRDIDSLWDEMDSREMKEQLIFVLSQQDDRDAIDMLIKIAKDERDPEIRGQAVFWLGQSDDPRAMDVLEDIITGN
ncbi:MAG: tetratricopeptide repeat protein [bacterium]|nr:tetratricopeptide repeat protein [bacterium]